MGAYIQAASEGGEFVGPDPRSVNTNANLVGYALDNPLRYQDRYGLAACPAGAAACVCCDGHGGFTVCWSQNVSQSIFRNCIEEHERDHIDWMTRNPGRCANQCYDSSNQPRPAGYNSFTMSQQDQSDMECRGYGVEVRCLKRNISQATNRGDVLRRINQLITAGRRNFNCNTRGW